MSAGHRFPAFLMLAIGSADGWQEGMRGAGEGGRVRQDKSGASMRRRKWRLHVVFYGGMPMAMPPVARLGPRKSRISAALPRDKVEALEGLTLRTLI